VAELSRSVVVRGWQGLQRQTEAGYQDVGECRRKHPLGLVLSNIELLRVFEPIEYRDWEQEGGDE
jgi:hypothetical protein